MMETNDSNANYGAHITEKVLKNVSKTEPITEKVCVDKKGHRVLRMKGSNWIQITVKQMCHPTLHKEIAEDIRRLIEKKYGIPLDTICFKEAMKTEGNKITEEMVKDLSDVLKIRADREDILIVNDYFR